MRRLWVVLAVTVVATALTANGVAYAHTNGAVASVSCASLAKRYEKGNSSASSINFGNPQSLDAAFRNAAKTFNSLANSAPSSLRPAFRALAKLYAHLTSVNLSNPSSLSALESIGTTYAKDFEAIGRYFAKKCGLTIPSPNAGTGTSTP
jgi:hypothetical protein